MSFLSPTKSFVFSGTFEEVIWWVSLKTAVIAMGLLLFMQEKFLLLGVGCQMEGIMQMERISERTLVRLEQNSQKYLSH